MENVNINSVKDKIAAAKNTVEQLRKIAVAQDIITKFELDMANIESLNPDSPKFKISATMAVNNFYSRLNMQGIR
ncbi:MAG: hypothetical protein FWE52_00655 [Alphaproteobacteria bacterium]|nr:hypothetical protein [Alphaproteobacteria bacterium]